MLTSLLLSVTTLMSAPLEASPAATLDESLRGSIVGVENQNGSDFILKSVKTEGCVTQFSGDDQSLTIDWRDIKWVLMEDPTFFAAKLEDDNLIGFITDGEKEVFVDRIALAATAARVMHLACDASARKIYEERANPPAPLEK